MIRETHPLYVGLYEGSLGHQEITQFVEGLPQRYLHLFPREAVYQHVRLARDIHPDEVHVSLESSDSAWTLAVVTLDKPHLLSNICGVLSSFGMNILRGHALTAHGPHALKQAFRRNTI